MNEMAGWASALAWGGMAGSALVIGAAIGCFADVPRRVTALVMAFGSGVLISALSIVLMETAYRQGGVFATALGFLGGATVFTLASLFVSRLGSRSHKHSKGRAAHGSSAVSGLAIAAGALLDGVPESVAIGVGQSATQSVGLATAVAVFLSNLPEGMASAADMRRAGYGNAAILALWSGITAAGGVAALIGHVSASGGSSEMLAVVNAVAAGAILAMLADTMIPEAYETAHDLTGLVVAFGFLASFSVAKWAGGA